MADSNNEITIEAKVDKLDEVIAFIDSILEIEECSVKTRMQIDVAAIRRMIGATIASVMECGRSQGAREIKKKQRADYLKNY